MDDNLIDFVDTLYNAVRSENEDQADIYFNKLRNKILEDTVELKKQEYIIYDQFAIACKYYFGNKLGLTKEQCLTEIKKLYSQIKNEQQR